MLGGALVWAWLVVGLRLLSSGGAWHVGWGGALFIGTLLWPAFAGGYFGMKRLIFGSEAERRDELAAVAMQTLLGGPLVAASFLASLLLLGAVRALDSFSTLPRGGVANFVMSVFALHLLAWAGAGAMHWAVTLWHGRDDD